MSSSLTTGATVITEAQHELAVQAKSENVSMKSEDASFMSAGDDDELSDVDENVSTAVLLAETSMEDDEDDDEFVPITHAEESEDEWTPEGTPDPIVVDMMNRPRATLEINQDAIIAEYLGTKVNDVEDEAQDSSDDEDDHNLGTSSPIGELVEETGDLDLDDVGTAFMLDEPADDEDDDDDDYIFEDDADKRMDED